MKQKKSWNFVGCIMLISLCCTFTAAGHIITSYLYGFTARPPEILAPVFSWLGGFLLMVTIFGFFRLVVFRHRFKDNRHRFYGGLINALGQISRGNFNVLIDPNDAGIYDELATAINEMAKNLGTLENMRQDFISNISHEIQSPLTSIGGFAVLLQGDNLTDEQRLHYAVIIKSECERLSRMSENLLKLSALESKDSTLSLTEFRLDRQIKNIILTLEPQWSSKSILPEVSLPVTEYMGDEELLSQLWINLLGNAIKFTPPQGKISVKLTIETDFYRIDIADTGIGMDAESQIHIFERFYKADKSRDRALGGNGLGLSLVKKIAQLHGGHITVESRLNKGSVFSVFLPLKK